MLHAGYSAFFTIDHKQGHTTTVIDHGTGRSNTATKNYDGWRVAYAQATEPVLAPTEIRQVTYIGKLYTVVVPNGYMFVRRAHRSDRTVQLSGFIKNSMSRLLLWFHALPLILFQPDYQPCRE